MSDASAVRAVKPTPTQSPAEGDEMLEPLIYAAMMHNGKPKTLAEFERAAANVADMLQRRAEVTHEKPVASIYISADGSREFDDWRVALPPGNHQLFTAPRSAQPQPESLPHPGTPEAEEMIDKLLAEYNRPANMKNAARAGYMAARRLLQWARTPLPYVQPKHTVVTVEHHEFSASRKQWRATIWTDEALPTGTHLYTAQAPAPEAATKGLSTPWGDADDSGEVQP